MRDITCPRFIFGPSEIRTYKCIERKCCIKTGVWTKIYGTTCKFYGKGCVSSRSRLNIGKISEPDRLYTFKREKGIFDKINVELAF